MNLKIIPPDVVGVVWPWIADDMQQACDRCESELTESELLQDCKAGDGFLIVIEDEGDIIMSSVWKPQTKEGVAVLRCEMMCGTRMREWLDMAFAEISAGARANGTKKLVAQGRHGWLRLFGGVVKNGPDMEIEI